MEEILEWIAQRDIAMLYFTRATDTRGPYFASYSAATGSKALIEGYVSEMYTTYGTRMSNTSRGVDPRGLDLAMPLAVGQFSHVDHDNGQYTVKYNVTRAGLYSLSVINMQELVHGAPFTFMVKPQVFEPSTCIVNGTGASKNKDTVTGTSDYRAALMAGTVWYLFSSTYTWVISCVYIYIYIRVCVCVYRDYTCMYVFLTCMELRGCIIRY